MSHRLRLAIVGVLLLACVTSRTAHADPNNGPPPERWGWVVVFMSLAAGGLLSGVSLSVDCNGDLDCAKWTSLGIWGGIGVASAGSVVGLLGVERARRAQRVRVSVSVDRSQHGASAPRATFVYEF